jgi:hypothetical protein
MKRFFSSLLLFLAPLLLIFGGLAAFLIYTGEAMPLSVVVALQSGDAPVLYRPRFGNRDFDYKLLASETRKPEILAVGSSRVLQFRAGFFNRKPETFYNAAAPAWTLQDIDDFLQALKHNPRILILALDHPWFNDAFMFEPPPRRVSDLNQLFNTAISVLQSLTIGDQLDFNFMLRRVEPKRGGLALGFRAIVAGHGFRNDGSEQYGDFLVAHYLSPDIERARHLDWMLTGQRMYVYGDHVSETRLAQLEAILARCKERGILVVGFTPSFVPSLYDEMLAAGRHGYISELPVRLREMFDRDGYVYFDFSDGETIGAKDADFFDGWHASELANLFLYLRMLETRPDIFGEYSDANGLYSIAGSATDTFDVFN